MIVSVTERGTFKRCRRKWDFSSFNRQGLQPAVTTSGALDLGTLIHKSLADWIVKRRFTDIEAARLDAEPGLEIPLPEIFKLHAAERLEELQVNYFKITGGATASPEEMNTFYSVVELGLAMMENYVEFHKTPLPSRMRWVSPEQKVRVPIPNTYCEVCSGSGKVPAYYIQCGNHSGVSNGSDYQCEQCITSDQCFGCDGIGQHLLEGTLDGLIQDERGRLYVLEHKTYGRRPKIETLDTSDQFLAYIWILKQLNIGKVGGIAYDGMWKRAKPPRGSSLGDLFCRTVLTRDKAELEEFESQLAEEVTDMADLSKRVPKGIAHPSMYINRQWQGCSDCGYLRLCRAMSRGEDVDYIRKTYYVQRIKDDPLGVAAGEIVDE